MQIRCHYYEVNFNLIQLPKGPAAARYWFMSHLYSGVVHQDRYSLNCHTCVKWHIYCTALCVSHVGLERSPLPRRKSSFTPLFWSVHTCCVPFCAEEEINLPTEGNCAHANCLEKPFFILYGAISSESLFENRQTLALILELWHRGVQKKAAPLSSPALCSGSAVQPPRPFPGQFLAHVVEMEEQLRQTCLMERVTLSSSLFLKILETSLKSFLKVDDWVAVK